MPKNFTVRLTAAAATVGFLATAAVAQADRSAAARMGWMATMTHQMAASVCLINHGIAVKAETRSLANARATIDRHMSALVASEILAASDSASANWGALNGAISMILAGDNPASYLDAIAENQPLLAGSLLDLQDLYTDPALVPTTADYLRTDLAERQEIFVQKMKLMACEMNGQTASASGKAQLHDMIELYEASLDALVNGMSEIGLEAPTDFGSNQVLAAAQFDWDNLKPMLEKIADAGTATSEDLIGLRARTNALGERMATLVAVYNSPIDENGDRDVAFLLEGGQ